MDKSTIKAVIKSFLAEKYECDESVMENKGLMIIKNTNNCKLKMLLFNDLTLVSVSDNMYDFVCNNLKDKGTYEIFEFPLVYGQSIFYVPNLNKVTKQEVSSKYDFKLFDGNAEEIGLECGFENAVSYEDGKCVSRIAYCAYKDGKVIGVAGADKVTDKIWEVGIEVLPEYRNEGLATILAKNLTVEILNKGIVPIWCSSVSNIASQAVATNSGYTPSWMETYGDIFDDGYVYKNIINNIKI